MSKQIKQQFLVTVLAGVTVALITAFIQKKENQNA